MTRPFLKHLLIPCIIVWVILFLPQATKANPGSTIPQVKVYSSDFSQIKAEFLAYLESFHGGVSIAVGDINGDGEKEIITGAGPTGGPHVRIYNAQGEWTEQEFFAYSTSFRGGISVAAGDINGDGIDEIITGAGPGGGPQVRVFNQTGAPVLQFYAYDQNFRGGVKVATGDVNGDGKDEIICGPVSVGGPHLRVFGQDGQPTEWEIFAFSKDFRGGLNIATGDVNGDGRDEIGVCPAGDAQAWCKIYQYDDHATILAQWNSFGTAECGAGIAMADLTGNSKAEVIVGAGPGGGPHVRVFDQKGEWIGLDTFAYHANFTGGLRLTAQDLDNDGQAEIITAPGYKKEEKITICQGLCVALTFDDGFINNNSFAAILDILKTQNVKATFFLLGKAMEENPDLIKRVVDEGHQLANHGYSHGDFTKMPEDQIRWEIINAEQIAQNLTAVSTKPYFRYPYRAFNDFTDQIIQGLGYQSILWTIDSYDSRSATTSAQVVDYTLRSLGGGANILFHTQSLATVQALEEIIIAIKNQGYIFAKVQEMP